MNALYSILVVLLLVTSRGTVRDGVGVGVRGTELFKKYNSFVGTISGYILGVGNELVVTD